MTCFICKKPIDPAREDPFLGYGAIIGLGSGPYHLACWPGDKGLK